jgi:hypothetical protein
MTVKRIIFSILIIAIACTIQGFIYPDFCDGQQTVAESKGPILDKWAFKGKDDKGVVWTGTLTIKKLDATSFDADRFHSMCILEAESKDSSNGVDAPCVWDPAKREVSFSTGTVMYIAILSANGKSIMQGKWTESKEDFQARKVTVIKTGVWSAEYTGS